MKHAKKDPKRGHKRQIQLKRLRVLTVLLVMALVGAAISIYRDYQARPGFLEKIWISGRGADYITVSWERARNVHKYVVTYNGKTIEVSGMRKSVTITGLTEDTSYKISVRADSKEREGFEALEEQARTKKSQTIEGEAEQVRFANRPVDLKQTAMTDLTYAPGKGYSVTEDGMIVFTNAGTVTVNAEASENEEYAGASKEVKVEVLDTVSTAAAGAKPHIFYKLNRDDCVKIRTVKGTKEANKPQSFVRKDGKYLVAYIKNDVQRVVSFGDKKTVYTPEDDLGHANGLTIANGRCYSVRGLDYKCIMFDHPDGSYDSFDLAYHASGIAYDEVKDLFYTTSRGLLVTYDSDFNCIKHIGRVDRKTRFYAQDCAAYDGILMQAISGQGYTGINYIDFYDMTSDIYLGSIECDLGEVESIIVNDEGYLELLCNVAGNEDNIWKTPFNIKKLVS